MTFMVGEVLGYENARNIIAFAITGLRIVVNVPLK